MPSCPSERSFLLDITDELGKSVSFMNAYHSFQGFFDRCVIVSESHFTLAAQVSRCTSPSESWPDTVSGKSLRTCGVISCAKTGNWHRPAMLHSAEKRRCVK